MNRAQNISDLLMTVRFCSVPLVLCAALACATFAVAQAPRSQSIGGIFKPTPSRWTFSLGPTYTRIQDGQQDGLVQRTYYFRDTDNEYFRWITTDAFGLHANMRFRAFAGFGINIGWEYLFRNHEIESGSYNAPGSRFNDSETGRFKVFETQGKFLSIWVRTASVPFGFDYEFLIRKGLKGRPAFLRPSAIIGIDLYEQNRYWRDRNIRYNILDQDFGYTTMSTIRLSTEYQTPAVYYPSVRLLLAAGQDFGKWGTWQLEVGYRANPGGEPPSIDVVTFESTHTRNFDLVTGEPLAVPYVYREDYEFPIYIGGATASIKWVKNLKRWREVQTAITPDGETILMSPQLKQKRQQPRPFLWWGRSG